MQWPISIPPGRAETTRLQRFIYLLQGHFAVRLLAHWYCNLTLSVRWHNAVSGGFGMKNGVRQGGILSPFLFRSVLRMLFLKLTLSIGYG